MAGEERKRVYQAWKGNNIFLCQGRLIFGLDASSLIATILLIAVPSIIFCALVARNLFHKFPDHNAGYAILVVAVVFTIYVLGLLLRTSARDPGIVPRNSHPPEEELSYDSGDAGGRPAQSVQLPRSKEVMVNGMPVKVKYCETCMLYRPPRCSHCSICNNCVEKFDHHCPWVGQCIGARNYRCFFMFISSSTLLCIFVFSMSALYIKFLMDEHGTVWKAMKKSPASVVLMLYCFIALWFVGGLTGFHSYLISRNQTTYENFRSRTTTSGINVHDRGCYNNFAEVFFTKTQPSKNKFRAFVKEETLRPARRSMPDLVEETSEDRRAKVETDDLETGDYIFKLSQRHTVSEAEDINGRGSDNLARGSSEPDFNLDPESQTDRARSDIRQSSRSRGASSSFDAATSHLQAFDSIVSGPK